MKSAIFVTVSLQKYTMNISFYLRGKSIYIDIYHKDFRIQKPTGRKFKEQPTEKKIDQLKVGNIANDRTTSNLLTSMKNAIEDFETECIKAQTRFTETATLKLLERLKTGKEVVVNRKKGFFEYFDEWIEESKHRISDITFKPLAKGTILRYKSAKNVLEKFETKYRYSLNLDSINDDFYAKFRKYILSDLKHSVNTFADNVKQLKTFCKWYQKKEPGLSNHFRDFAKPFSYADAEPLKEEELLALYDKTFEEPTLEKARLILLFLCSTGMRISDYNEFNPEVNIKDEAIVIRTVKTNKYCYIPYYDDLYFRPIAVLKELQEKFKNIKISGQKLNEYIKNVGNGIELKRIIITTKTGRKTFATLKLLSGVPAEVIMKSTGHKTRPSFDAYVGIDHSDIIKQNKDKARDMRVA
jgi:integrase